MFLEYVCKQNYTNITACGLICIDLYVLIPVAMLLSLNVMIYILI